MSQNHGQIPQINSTVSFSLNDVTFEMVIIEANESLKNHPGTTDEDERFIIGCNHAFFKHAGNYGVAVCTALDDLAKAMEASGIDEKTRQSLIDAVEESYIHECMAEKEFGHRMSQERGYRQGVAEHALMIVKASKA